MEPRVKYPRTPHLPGSPGAGADDLHHGPGALAGCTDVVVTEKLDGECTTLYRDGLHARSIDSRHHPSRSHVKALHARVAADIGPGMRICGENLYARHSLAYDQLPAYFLVFNIWQGHQCLSWDDTVEWAGLLGLHLVPVLYRGPMTTAADLHRRWAATLGPDRSEGFVVRDAGTFTLEEFTTRTGKWVRPGHVTTSDHWMAGPITPNRLRTPTTDA